MVIGFFSAHWAGFRRNHQSSDTDKDFLTLRDGSQTSLSSVSSPSSPSSTSSSSSSRCSSVTPQASPCISDPSSRPPSVLPVADWKGSSPMSMRRWTSANHSLTSGTKERDFQGVLGVALITEVKYPGINGS